MSSLPTWNHRQTRSAFLAHTRSGWASPDEAMEGNLHARLEISHPVCQEVLTLLDTMHRSTARFPLGKAISVKKTVRANPRDDSLNTYMFSIRVHERSENRTRKSGRLLLSLDYSLSPNLGAVDPKSKLRQEQVRWYLNVGCNVAMLAGLKSNQQVRGFDHPYLDGETRTSRRALTLLYTMGYWWLEDEAAELFGDESLRFRWPDDVAADILAGKVVLNDVSFAFWGADPITEEEANNTSRRLRLVYGNTHPFTRIIDGKRVKWDECVGEYLNVTYEKLPVKFASDKGYDFNPARLTKMYGNHRKCSITIDSKQLPINGEVATHARRQRYTVSLSQRFFQYKRTDRSKPFTLADFLDMCEDRSGLPSYATIFDKHYAFAGDLFDETAEKDFMLTQLMQLDPQETVSAIRTWAGTDKAKKDFVYNWAGYDSPEITTWAKRSKDLDVPQSTLKRYAAQLKLLGIDIKLPLPMYLLLVRATVMADMTLQEISQSFSSLERVDAMVIDALIGRITVDKLKGLSTYGSINRMDLLPLKPVNLIQDDYGNIDVKPVEQARAAPAVLEWKPIRKFRL